MTIYELNPIQDSRWAGFIENHPQASMFHTGGWLSALQRTYGYEPVAFTTSAPDTQLENGVVFCRVKSWLTGHRLVSLPFSDHCQPLVSEPGQLRLILDRLRSDAGAKRWKYIELRPLDEGQLDGMEPQFAPSMSYGFHKIDLRPAPETIFRGFHDSCVRRKIRKAEREQLSYEAGRSESLLGQFHQLLLLTRRRHKLPPQPLAWFRNLIDCLGEALTIRVVSRNSQPVASILTVLHKNCVVYKYGCSDPQFNNLGGTSLLFWKAIQESKQLGAEEMDLGRSDLEDPGLSAFKAHLGGAASELKYYRYSLAARREAPGKTGPGYLREAFAHMPDPIFTGVGRLLYRHMG